MIFSMYSNLQRSTKIGIAYGNPFTSFNGMGQGDIATLFLALAVVSGQFYMINLYYPSVRMGACIDDRNYRGSYEDVVGTYELISEYDQIAGHMTQPLKNAMAATDNGDVAKIQNLVLDGAAPKLVTHEVLVGDLISTVARNSKSHVNSKVDKAYAMPVRLDFIPVPRSEKIAASCTAIMPPSDQEVK